MSGATDLASAHGHLGGVIVVAVVVVYLLRLEVALQGRAMRHQEAKLSSGRQ